MQASNIIGLGLAAGLCWSIGDVARAEQIAGDPAPGTLGLPEWAERPDDEVYVFGLQLDRFNLTEGLIVFYDGEEAFVPLGGFVEALEFPISVDPENGTAQGWFLNDDRRFELDLSAGLVTVEGRSSEIAPAAIERHPDDLYEKLAALEAWFPLLLELRFRRL